MPHRILSRLALAACATCALLLSGCGERSATETRDELGARTPPGADGLGAGNPATAGTGGVAAAPAAEGGAPVTSPGTAMGPSAGAAGSGNVGANGN